MRVTSIHIGRWRNLEGVQVDIPPEATLICLVGENGTGKSTILELLAQCAGALGLATGVQLKRPALGADQHDVTVTLRLPEGFDLAAAQFAPYEALLDQWDGTLIYHSSNPPTDSQAAMPIGVRAGGLVDPGVAQHVGQQLVSLLQQRQEVNHLYIDADRAFNPVAIQDQEIWGLIRQDLKVPSYVRQQASLLTQNMYAEWLKSMLAGALRLSRSS